MATLSFFTLAILFYIGVVSTAYKYNDFKHFHFSFKQRYPDTCCQLEWIDIKQGDALPKDYVLAGKFMNRNWAYIGGKWGSLAVKSDQADEKPNWIGNDDNKVYPYPILTNPNNCKIGWYKTRFNGEGLPKNSDWHFPRLDHGTKGDFGQLNGIPSKVIFTGSVDTISSLTDFTRSKPDHYELLYVDCKKSMPKTF